MKKYIFYTLASVVTFLTFSCSKDTEVQTPDKPVPVDPIVPTEKSVVLSGDVDATKVSSDNNGAYKWQASDIITILTDNGNNREFTAKEAGISTDFSGHIPDADTLAGGFALYPASDKHSISSNTITFNMPSELAWGADASYMPMYAPITIVEQKPSASFKAVGGALKLILYNIPSGATYLAFTAASVNIAGNFSLNTLAAEPTISGGESKEIDINFSDNYSANKVFYIPLPPVTLTGGFTISIFDDEANELFSVTSTKGITIGRNKLVIAPALNCASATIMWKETFTGYGADKDWETSASIETTSPTYDAVAYGGASITYTSADGVNDTKTYTGTMLAGGDEPELLINKSTKSGTDGGSFTVSGIPTNGASSLALTFRENGNLVVRTTTTGASVSGSYDSQTKTYSGTITTGSASAITLEFVNQSTSNIRIDDIVVTQPAAAPTAPTITTNITNINFAVGTTSRNVTVTYANPVDELGINCVLSGTNEDKFTASLSGSTLTITATEPNSSASDYAATLTLKATGASKVLNLTQVSALVKKPSSISVVPGNASFSASWAKADHATGYKAYLHTAETATPATGGTELTPYLDDATYSVSGSGLTNSSTYYLYVKVNSVDEGYVAEDAYKMVSFVPNNTIYYEKVEDDLDDWSGEYLFVWGTNAHYAVTSSGLTTTASVSISDNKIATTEHASHKITIEKVTENNVTSYYIKLPSGNYVDNASGSNTCTESDTRSQAYTFEINSSGYAVITGNGSKILQKNGNYCRFYNDNSNFTKPMLFKLNDPRSAAGLAWKKNSVAANSDSATMLTGSDTMPTIALDNPHGLTVSYSSTVSTVATINSSTGAITLVGAGTTVISAEFADGDATYKPQTVSYTLTVTDNRTVPVITLTTTDVELTDSNYNTFTGRTATVDQSVTLVYSKVDASSIIGEFNTSNGVLALNGNTGSATVTVSFNGNTEYKAAESKSYTIIVASSSGPSPLDPPASPTITVISASAFTATWTAAANASGYSWKLSASNDPTAAAVSSGTVTGGSTATVTKTGLTLTKGTKYYFHIKSNGDGANYSDSSFGSSSSVSYNTFTINAGDVVSGTSYKTHSATVSSRGWIVTFGGNNSSVGTNGNNRSKCNLGSYSKYAVTPVTASDVASAFANTTSISNVTNISYSFSGGSNQTSTNVYLLYSEAGSSFSQMSLSSGTQGASISSGTVYSFAKCSGYFAVLFKATNSSGNWRIDAVQLTFTYIE